MWEGLRKFYSTNYQQMYIHNKWLKPHTLNHDHLTSLMSPLLDVGVELSEVVVETLAVRRSFGLCLTTSLLLTRGPLRSAISDADFTANRDEASPPEWVRLREGEWLEFAAAPL